MIDADLELTVGEVGGTDLGLKDVELQSTITESSVERSPFSFRLHDSRFTGSVSADLTSAPPSARFELGTQNIDIALHLLKIGVIDQFQLFQMPYSFSRLAATSPRSRALARSSFGKVSPSAAP